MNADSVTVAVTGFVPWSYECAACHSPLFYFVTEGVPKAMFCGRADCRLWLQERPFPSEEKRGEEERR